MDVHQPLQLLAGLSPHQFMRRHWQKKPLLVRQAVPAFSPELGRRALFDLAGRADVESRLVVAPGAGAAGGWKLRHGPFGKRSLPPVSRPGWTLLVQGVDQHVAMAREALNQFRFVPDARLDDVMVSYATDAGGVGPHFDSYDVFLLQAQGQRRWRFGRQKKLDLLAGVPLKILASFEPDQDVVLAPGDMLYLPPRYAHEGVAVGECMTWSIGFQAPAAGMLASDLLQRLAHDAADDTSRRLYRDPGQLAVANAAEIPPGLTGFARNALQTVLETPLALERVLGESLTEPKNNVWFDSAKRHADTGDLRLDPRTRMMYDDRHVFVNGESFVAGGRDAELIRRLADARCLALPALAAASPQAMALLRDWCSVGWMHGL
ncbi:MAG: cupin domain-containing protein [Rhodoferax sp.]|nr:cupin domain-containing protein [Rhodoferax sp.]